MNSFITCLRCRILLVFMVAVSSAAAANDDDARSWVDEIILGIDSLKYQLNTQPLSAKQQMEFYANIAGAYHPFELDSAIVYRFKSLALAQTLNEYEMMMDNHLELGLYYSFKGIYDEAFNHIDQSLSLAVEHGNLRKEMHAVASFGFMYFQQGKYNMSMAYYLKYLPIVEREGWINSCIGCLANLSEINRRLGNWEIALQYLKQAEEKSNNMEEGSYRWLMPQVYNEYAHIYLARGDYNEALRNTLIADSINVENGTINKCQSKILLASIYLHWNDYERAMQYAKESYEQADILKDISLYMDAGKIMSDVYLAQKRYHEAETEAYKAWQIDSTNLEVSRALVHNMALANICMGNTDKAAEYLKKYAELNAQYTEKSFHTTLTDMTFKYETEKKEERIALLEIERQMFVKERVLYIGLGVTGIFLAVSLGIVLSQYVRNARKNQQLIASEALQDGEIGERARIANDLHDRLGGSLSAAKIGLKNTDSLQNISDKLEECIIEVREVTNNIMPRSLRLFGLKGALEDLCAQFSNVYFHFFGEDNRIRYNQEYSVYCCARELVNNAQKHSGATNINVQLVQSKKYLTLTVEDNGCGYDEKTVVKGDGLQIIHNRVASCKGKMDIASSPGKGTETVIELVVRGERP